MANTMEHLYGPISKSLSIKNPTSISIVLQNQLTTSNAFVTLAPRHSEFYTMSPQFTNFLGNNDWLNLLATHEYRHVVQYNRSKTGLTGLAYYLFGEATQSAIATVTVPQWFWEGDAVDMETALTHSGRGRLPYFTREFRANLMEKGSFNYSKQYLRSFKDFIPNHYVLGYHLTTYLKDRYGESNMQNMVGRTWKVPIIPFGYSFSIKKFGGEKLPQSYQSMMSELKKKWSKAMAQENFTSFKKINKNQKAVYTNLNYPQLTNDGEIIVYKTGLDDYGEFVSVDPQTGIESKVFVPGLVNDAGMLSVQGNTIVWNEFEFDPRWRARSYSVIKTFNIATRQLSRITFRSRYSSASLSPNRAKVLTVEESTDYTNRVVILDAYSGKVLKTFKEEDGAFYTQPVWDNTGLYFTVMKVKNSKKSIWLVNAESGKWRLMLEPSYEQISYVTRYDDWLYYVSARSGIDNVYALNISAKKKYRVTSAKYGAYNPVVSKDGHTLFYNNFTVLGNDIVSMSLDPSKFMPIDQVKNLDISWYQPVVHDENNANILSTVPDSTYSEKRYHKRPFNVHSWGPLYSGTLDEIEVGMFSRNILNTTDLFLGYNFNNRGENRYVGRLSYQGLYPIVDVIGTYGHRKDQVNFIDTLNTLQTDRIKWDELIVKGGFRLPFLFTHNRFHTTLEILNYVGLTSVSGYSSTRLGDGRYFSLLNNGTLVQNEFDATLISLHKQSKRDIQSKWGTILAIEQFGTPYGGNFNGGLTAFKGQFYFPGLVKHHSLNFFMGFQHNKITLDKNNYWFSNRMPYPRGVSARTFQNLFTLRTNYEFPLLYPDMKIGPWLYIQRIKTNLFYDFGRGTSNVVNREQNLQIKDSQTMNSLGIDLTFDFNVMRALPLMEVGFRFAFVPDTQSSTFEFLIGKLGF